MSQQRIRRSLKVRKGYNVKEELRRSQKYLRLRTRKAEDRGILELLKAYKEATEKGSCRNEEMEEDEERLMSVHFEETEVGDRIISRNWRRVRKGL